jgi:hypothetical protein
MFYKVGYSGQGWIHALEYFLSKKRKRNNICLWYNQPGDIIYTVI